MSRKTKPLRALGDSPALLPLPPEKQRLLDLMAGWWRGDSQVLLSFLHQISRQRVGAILHRAGCRPSDRKPGRIINVTRAGPAQRTDWCRQLLASAATRKLTPRQLGACAWGAMGMSTTDIARRMGISAQRVEILLATAFRVQHRRNPFLESPPTEMPTTHWSGLESFLRNPT